MTLNNKRKSTALNEKSHYTVEGRIDGKWFKNDFVFTSVEEATAYGIDLVDNKAIEKYRLWATDKPVKLPVAEQDQNSDKGD